MKTVLSLHRKWAHAVKTIRILQGLVSCFDSIGELFPLSCRSVPVFWLWLQMNSCDVIFNDGKRDDMMRKRQHSDVACSNYRCPAAPKKKKNAVFGVYSQHLIDHYLSSHSLSLFLRNTFEHLHQRNIVMDYKRKKTKPEHS